MKRTASQTFSQASTIDVSDTGSMVGCSKEGAKEGEPSSSLSHSHSSKQSLSKAVVGSYKQIRRRLSTSSSRRPSFASESTSSSSTLKSKESYTNEQSPHLNHQDSVFTTIQEQAPTSSKSFFRCFSSLRQRRPAASGPSGETARFNPVPAPIPANYPMLSPPGSAARAAAAAANSERLNLQKRQEEYTQRFLETEFFAGSRMEDVTKDSESGVGMTCSTPVEPVQEKRLDPINYLPAELSAMILSNLEAPSLVIAERVASAWNEAASSSHVWRNVFLRKFEPQIHVSPTPIMMGGAGIGKRINGKPAPGQNWKQMYKVRKTIERRWKAGTPSAIYLNGHTDSVYCCQFDENKIITGSRDRTIRVWDMKTFKCIKVIGGPNNRPLPNTPHSLAIRAETVVNHASLNGTPEGHDIYHVPHDFHEASILCLQYDDEIMVTGSSDHTCIVWDITGSEYKPLYRLRKHSAGVLDVCLDDKHIISCSKDLTINVWSRATGQHMQTLTGHRGPVNAVQLRGNLLVSASGDGVAKLWNLESGSCIKEFPSQDRGLAAVEFSDDAKYVLAGGNDHVVYKFDALTGQLLHTSEKHGGLVRSLFLDAHNGRVVSGSYDQSIRVADYETGVTYGTYDNWTTSWILSAKSDYRRVVATSQDGRALLLDFGWNVRNVGMLVDGEGRVDEVMDVDEEWVDEEEMSMTF
ncbi:WD40 repeat-like protein [Delitschia confertaspora ATCC 74209]|uniref:WD40 repeat-like protein n=1 Tax=Delitschia confertaspora ATCC 74209 TaxID=1513339 RepID=A0A9P4MT89_9PLEO|nr:WD40 repeat-like protein [Delitschia confertaspora ATCC 74209]